MRRRARLPRSATSERPPPYDAGVSSARAERLVNLVLCLLATRQFLSAERIRATVPGYADAATDDAFFRMFERDKTELRELGVPLETGRNSAFDTADGYRIARQDYELGEIDLESDEVAAVALAARLWDTPGLAGAAHGALVKLRAVPITGGRATPRSTTASRSTPGGTVTPPGAPSVVTGPAIRESRKERTSARSRSWPTRYQRPRAETTPHGSTVRCVTSPVGPPRRCGKVTT